MTIELFALAEYVSNHNGRLTIIDTFDAIVAEKFPWRAYFGIAVKIGLSPEESSKDSLTMRILADDGMVIFDAATKLNLPDKEKAGKLVIASNVKGLIFPRSGNYSLEISSDSELIGRFLFEVKNHIERTMI